MKNDATINGFTLLEVLVAMALLSVGLLAVAALQSTAARSNDKAEQLNQALALGRTKIEEIVSMDYGVCNSSSLTNGTDGNYLVNYTITPDNPVANSTKQIDVIISWSGYGKNNSLMLSYIKAK